MTAENVSNGLRWRLALHKSLRKVKVARRAGWALVERVPKTAPKAAVFCHLFTETETYLVRGTSFTARCMLNCDPYLV